MLLRRALVGVGASAVLTAGIVVIASPAHACSCVPEDVSAWLPEAEGAFVGIWRDRNVIGGGQAMVTFDVQQVVKGSFGPTAIVRTVEQGSACGLEALGRTRTGLLLRLAGDGVWESDLCWMVDPDGLLAVADSHPPDPAVAPIGAGWSLASKAMAIAALVLAAGAVLTWWARRRRGLSAGPTPVT